MPIVAPQVYRPTSLTRQIQQVAGNVVQAVVQHEAIQTNNAKKMIEGRQGTILQGINEGLATTPQLDPTHYKTEQDFIAASQNNYTGIIHGERDKQLATLEEGDEYQQAELMEWFSRQEAAIVPRQMQTAKRAWAIHLENQRQAFTDQLAVARVGGVVSYEDTQLAITDQATVMRQAGSLPEDQIVDWEQGARRRLGELEVKQRIQTGDLAGARAVLNDPGTGLEAEKVLQLTGVLNQQEVAQTQVAVHAALQSVQNEVRVIQAGLPVDPTKADEALASLPPSAYQDEIVIKASEELRHARGNQTAILASWSQSLEESAGAVQVALTSVIKDPTPENQALYEGLLQAHQRKGDALQKDPMAVAVQTQVVPQHDLDPFDAASLVTAHGYAKQAAATYGTRVQIGTNQQVEAIRQAITTDYVRGQAISASIYQALGQDEAAMDGFIARIADDDVALHQALAEATYSPDNAEKIMRGYNLRKSVRTQRLYLQGFDDALKGSESFADLKQAVSPEILDALVSRTESIYLADSADPKAEYDGIIDGKRLDKAFKQILNGGVVEFGNRKIIPPEPGVGEEEMQARIEHVIRTAPNLHHLIADEEITDVEQIRETLLDALDDGLIGLETVGDGFYHITWDSNGMPLPNPDQDGHEGWVVDLRRGSLTDFDPSTIRWRTKGFSAEDLKGAGGPADQTNAGKKDEAEDKETEDAKVDDSRDSEFGSVSSNVQ